MLLLIALPEETAHKNPAKLRQVSTFRDGNLLALKAIPITDTHELDLEIFL